MQFILFMSLRNFVKILIIRPKNAVIKFKTVGLMNKNRNFAMAFSCFNLAL